MQNGRNQRENNCINTEQRKKRFDVRSTFKAMMLKPVINSVHLAGKGGHLKGTNSQTLPL